METITPSQKLLIELTEPIEKLKKEAVILEALMNKWTLNKSQTAKILGVEPWSVGAWLSGKREISAKYKERIDELLKIPLNEDLLIAPAVNTLVHNIWRICDETDASKLKNALVKIMNAVESKLSKFKIGSIDAKMINSLKNTLYVYDDYSIAQLNQLTSAALSERTYIASLSGKEFAEKIFNHFETNGPCANFSMSYECGTIIIWNDVQFSDWRTENIEAIKRTDPYYAREVIDELKEEAIAETEEIFKDTAFERERSNDELIGNDIYQIGYEIHEDHPGFKENMRLIMNRLNFHPDFLSIA